MWINDIIRKLSTIPFPWCKSFKEEQNRESQMINEILTKSANNKKTDE